MSRIALLGAASGIFAVGIGAALALTPQGGSRPLDCVVGICVPTAVPPLPVPVPLPEPAETAPTTTTTPAPAQPTTDAAPAQPPAPAPVDHAPEAQPVATLQDFQVAMTGRGANRALALTLIVARPANAALHVHFRPRAVHAAFKLRTGRNVRTVKIPAQTRAGRYVLTLTVRDAGGGVQTHRRTSALRRSRIIV